MRTGDTRKIFHFSIFTCAAVLSLTVGVAAVNLLGGLMAIYLFTILRIGEGNLFYEGVARETDRPQRSLYVLVPFLATAAGGILSSFVFGHYATVGYVAGGWGDAVAEPLGIRFGKHRYRVPNFGGGVQSDRSIEGSAAVFLASFVGVGLVLALGDVAEGSPLAFLVLVSACVATASTVIEAFSPHGLDNLTIMLTASAVAYGMMGGANP